MPPSIRLDHVIVAANTLDEGEAWLRARLGVGLDPGGSHTGWGTHNRLLQLGGGTYLELIAPDPAQPEPTRPRLFGLDGTQRTRIASRPRVIHLAMQCPGLASVLPGLPWRPGHLTAMRRGDLAWQITIPGDSPDGLPCLPDGEAAGGLLPTLIDWGDAAHPSTRLVFRGVTLIAVRLAAPPAIAAVLAGLRAHEPRLEITPAQPGHAAIGIELATPDGWSLLD